MFVVTWTETLEVSCTARVTASELAALAEPFPGFGPVSTDDPASLEEVIADPDSFGLPDTLSTLRGVERVDVDFTRDQISIEREGQA